MLDSNIELGIFALYQPHLCACVYSSTVVVYQSPSLGTERTHTKHLSPFIKAVLKRIYFKRSMLFHGRRLVFTYICRLLYIEREFFSFLLSYNIQGSGLRAVHSQKLYIY